MWKQYLFVEITIALQFESNKQNIFSKLDVILNMIYHDISKSITMDKVMLLHYVNISY